MEEAILHLVKLASDVAILPPDSQFMSKPPRYHPFAQIINYCHAQSHQIKQLTSLNPIQKHLLFENMEIIQKLTIDALESCSDMSLNEKLLLSLAELFSVILHVLRVTDSHIINSPLKEFKKSSQKIISVMKLFGREKSRNMYPSIPSDTWISCKTNHPSLIKTCSMKYIHSMNRFLDIIIQHATANANSKNQTFQESKTSTIDKLFHPRIKSDFNWENQNSPYNVNPFGNLKDSNPKTFLMSDSTVFKNNSVTSINHQISWPFKLKSDKSQATITGSKQSDLGNSNTFVDLNSTIEKKSTNRRMSWPLHMIGNDKLPESKLSKKETLNETLVSDASSNIIGCIVVNVKFQIEPSLNIPGKELSEFNWKKMKLQYDEKKIYLFPIYRRRSSLKSKFIGIEKLPQFDREPSHSFVMKHASISKTLNKSNPCILVIHLVNGSHLFIDFQSVELMNTWALQLSKITT